MRLRVAEIAAATGGHLVGPDVTVDGASIDSRDLAPGALFVPIVDARDGHDFVTGAVARGAAAYLTARPAPEPGAEAATAIVVADTAAALLAVGRLARTRLDGGARPATVVGITGSVGKTTTKDLLAAALATTLRTAASLRSFNNELGVPLTLVNAPDDTEAVVVEMGARGRGHIALLCSIAHPTIAVVTAVEMVHTELFGSLDEVAEAKGELVEALPTDGAAVLNGDNPRVAAMATRTTARVLTFGRGDHPGGVDLWAEDVTLDDDLRPRFVLHSPWGRAPLHLAVRGRHNVANALAAAGAALLAGVPLDGLARGLEHADLSAGRMDLRRALSGALVLDDAYNAGPASVTAALHALVALGRPRSTAVLGVMAELGPEGPAAHRALAEEADRLGVRVIAVDAPDYGPTAEHVIDRDAALARLRADGGPDGDDAVLVKGSRVAGLEAVAAALRGDDSPAGGDTPQG
jgi:UDP-N-acetylmuramoyl-tripeptide--D-alanyl-D-alanine ligase